ncbi:MAG TPA: hemolysin family protein [Candidatus Saccharimonadales bacterium]|nr:hemolysin family protein [Candidatus Saccharimonadales bacterium]
MDPAAWQLLFLELVLVIFLAILSMSEAALHAIRRPELLEELTSRGRRGRRAGRMGERRVRYLAAVQVTEFFVIFSFAGIAAAFIAPRLSELLRFFFNISAVFSDVSAVVVSVAILSLIAVLFGLFVPRAIGDRHAQRVLLVLVWPLELVILLTRPLVAVLFLLTRIITRPLGANFERGTLVSEEDIKALIETGEAQGVLQEGERDMIHSVFALGDKTVDEVMIPRTDIVAIDVTTAPDKVLEQVVSAGHSRIPVFEGSADEIIGVLYVKDLFRRMARGEKDITIRPFLRAAQFVPETKKVDELLREMQRDKVHIAIVVDEYGGTAGLVTIEDLVEEIVGEIRDEYDVEQELVLPVSEHEAFMDARVPFDEVKETFGLDALESSENYDTLGGFITHALGRFPKAGETVDAAGVRFTVESIEGRRIRRVRVVRLMPAEEPA